MLAGELGDYAVALLAREDVGFVDLHSVRNNCLQTRIWAV